MADQKYLPASVDSLARLHTAEAVGAIVTVMRDKFARPADVLKAAELILDRGHGKAAQAVISIPARAALAQRMASMDDSQLLAIAAAARAAGVKPVSYNGMELAEQPTLPVLPAFGYTDVTEGELVQADPPAAPPESYGEGPAAKPDEFPKAGRAKAPEPWE